MYMNTTYSTKQSAVAMRKRMSDDTNKYNFNRKRILDRIREGSIPQQNTTKKYDISNAEVNAIRKEGNHPPLVVAFAPSAYAPTLAVNEETKRIQAQYLEQQQLTENVKEDEQKLVQSFKKLMVEQRGKILKVPPGQQFALKTFHDYVWNRGADGQPTSWVINITGKKAKETTIQMRFGKENDWKSGQVYLFLEKHRIPGDINTELQHLGFSGIYWTTSYGFKCDQNSGECPLCGKISHFSNNFRVTKHEPTGDWYVANFSRECRSTKFIQGTKNKLPSFAFIL